MKPPISARLLKCCEFINDGVRVADIGTDHGYLGIHLIQTQKASFVIASDINEMPLNSARVNAEKYHTSEQMSFYLSDGARDIPRDFDVLVCAGMGADTMIGIIEAAPWLKKDRYRLVLQCQSKRPELRAYLMKSGFEIKNESLVKDGRFVYTVMEVYYTGKRIFTPGECYISASLQNNKGPLFEEFYKRVVDNLKQTIDGYKLKKEQIISDELVFMEQAYSELLKLEGIDDGQSK